MTSTNSNKIYSRDFKINGWWLAVGLMALIDYFHNAQLEYTWVTIFNILCVLIGFGLAFKYSQFTRDAK